MSDIIREIDEDLRREDWEKVWQRYGKYVIAGAVGIVLVTASVIGWREYDQRQRAAAGERFAEIVERAETAGEPATAADLLAEYATAAPDGYAALARLRQAKLLADTGDRAAAAAAYDAIADDGDTPDLFQDLAVLYAVRMRIGEAAPAALIERLDPLAEDGMTWRYTARELKAIILLGVGDIAAGREIYTQLADDLDTPRSQRARAAEMLRAIGAEGVQPGESEGAGAAQ